MNSNVNIIVSIIVIFFMIFLIIPVNTHSADDEVSEPDIFTFSNDGLPEDQWPGFKGDTARTGNTSATGLGYYYLSWSVNFPITNNGWWSSPVVLYDQVYIGTPSGVRCYDLSGNSVWTYNAVTRYGTPLVYNGRVYVPEDNGNLHCLSANATGSGTTTRYWIYSPGGGTSHSSPVTDGTRIYYTVMAESGVHAVYMNGTKAWNASLGGSTRSESSPAIWNGRVYCGSGNSWSGGNNYIFSFNASTGETVWSYLAGGEVCSTPAVAYGCVYFGSVDGKVYCLNANGSGGSTTKLWDYDTNATNGFFGSPAVAYGKVYIGASNSFLYCLNAIGNDGNTTEYWNTSLTPPGAFGICSSPTVTPDYVYAGTTGFEFYCIERADGDIVWSKNFIDDGSLHYGISISPAVYKDKVIAGQPNGYLYFMEADVYSPKIVDTIPVSDAIDVNPASNISIKFDEAILISSLTTTSVSIVDSQSNPITGTVSADMSEGNLKAFFTPTSELEKDETYTVTVNTDVKDIRGNTLDGNGNGVAEGTGVDEYIFSFTTIQHGKPLFHKIPKLSLTEDVPYILDIGLYVSDSDTAKKDLVVKHNTTYGTLDDFNLTLLYTEGILNDLINISISDGVFTVYQLVVVEISPINDLPAISSIPLLELTEDISFELDMKKYVTDVDTTYESLKMFDNSKYATIKGMIINFTYTEGITEETVNISIRDSGYTVYTDIDVLITPVNDPPEFEQIPDVYVEEDLETEVSCAKYISDIDTYKEQLKIIVESPYVTVLGHKLIMLYPEKISEDDLIVKVFDGDNYAQITLKVFVIPVNDPPEIVSVESPIEGHTYEYNESIDLLAIVTDPDLEFGDSLTFLWLLDNIKEIANTQNATDVVIDPGIHTVSLIITDFEGSTDRHDVSIIVKHKPAIDDPDSIDDPQDPTDPDKTDDKKSEDSSLLWLGLVLAVVVVVLVILFTLFMRKKKLAEREAPASLPQQEVPAQYTMMPPSPGMEYQQQLPEQYPMQQEPGQIIDQSMEQDKQFMMEPPQTFDQMGQVTPALPDAQISEADNYLFERPEDEQPNKVSDTT